MQMFDRHSIERALQLHCSASPPDFDLNPSALPVTDQLHDSAVLIAFMEIGHRIEIVLTKRTSHLTHHPGQIAFPGGKVDAQDENFISAALREGWEEIALPPDAVMVLGELPSHQTVTGFNIVPVVGWIAAPWDVIINEKEVEEIFTVPAAHVLNPENYRIETRIWKGQKRRYFSVPFESYYIWGATARILRELAERFR